MSKRSDSRCTQPVDSQLAQRKTPLAASQTTGLEGFHCLHGSSPLEFADPRLQGLKAEFGGAGRELEKPN